MESYALLRRSIIFLTVFCGCPISTTAVLFLFLISWSFQCQKDIFFKLLPLKWSKLERFFKFIAKIKVNFTDCCIFIFFFVENEFPIIALLTWTPTEPHPPPSPTLFWSCPVALRDLSQYKDASSVQLITFIDRRACFY